MEEDVTTKYEAEKLSTSQMVNVILSVRVKQQHAVNQPHHFKHKESSCLKSTTTHFVVDESACHHSCKPRGGEEELTSEREGMYSMRSQNCSVPTTSCLNPRDTATVNLVLNWSRTSKKKKKKV